MFTQKTSKSIAALAGILTLALGAGIAAAQDPTEYGKAQFMRYCAICHGTTGVGDGPIGELLVKAPDGQQRTACREY